PAPPESDLAGRPFTAFSTHNSLSAPFLGKQRPASAGRNNGWPCPGQPSYCLDCPYTPGSDVTPALLNALQNPALYDHPVSGFTLMETHISWVLLTGEFVYKIKKPVNFGFLDFSSLDQRAHYCAEELRLNRRLAPDLY